MASFNERFLHYLITRVSLQLHSVVTRLILAGHSGFGYA